MVFKIIVVALLICIAIDVEEIVKIMKEHNSNEVEAEDGNDD